VSSKLPRREQQQSYEVGKITSCVYTAGICVKEQSPHLYWIVHSCCAGERFRLYLDMDVSELESSLMVEGIKQKKCEYAEVKLIL